MSEQIHFKSKEFLMRLASYCSVGTALVLVVVKIIAFYVTNSLALLSSMFDSGLDMGASIVSLIAISQALAPADKEHRFGHGKAEALGGFIQGIIIFCSACFLIIETIEHILDPVPLQRLNVGLIVMLISIFVTTALISFQRYVIKRTQSVSIDADNAHYTGDILMNVGVIISMCLSYHFGWMWMDALFAAVVAIYLFYSAFKIIRKVFKILMDAELSPETRKKIKEIVALNPEVLGIKDLRTRTAGIKSFIQFSILLDQNISLTKAHELCTLLEEQVKKQLPACEVFIHAEPKQHKE